MKYFVISFLITLILIIIIYSFIEEKTKYKDQIPEEPTEKDKTLRAFRALIYIIIAIIVIGFVVKLGILGAILS